MSHFAFSGNRLHTCHDTTSHGPFSFWFATHPWSDEKIYRIYRILDWIVKRRILHFFVGSRIATHRNSSLGAHSRTKDRVGSDRNTKNIHRNKCKDPASIFWTKGLNLMIRYKEREILNHFIITFWRVSFLKRNDRFSKNKTSFELKAMNDACYILMFSQLISSVNSI